MTAESIAMALLMILGFAACTVPVDEPKQQSPYSLEWKTVNDPMPAAWLSVDRSAETIQRITIDVNELVRSQCGEDCSAIIANVRQSDGVIVVEFEQRAAEGWRP